MDVKYFSVIIYLLFNIAYCKRFDTKCNEKPPKGHPLCKFKDTCIKDTGNGKIKISWNHYLLRNCFCSETCGFYGDCCETGVTKAKPLPDNTFSCKRVKDIFSYKTPLWVIDRCPKSWKGQTTRKRCEVPNKKYGFSNWPVTGMKQKLYQNIYCAHCHGEYMNAFWQSTLRCNATNVTVEWDDKVTDIIKKYESTGTCERQYLNPSLKGVLPHCKDAISKCPKKWKDKCVRKKCEHPNAEVRFRYVRKESLTFKNGYCALCNGYRQEANCKDTVNAWAPRPYSPQNPRLPVAFSITVDVSAGAAAAEKMEGGVTTKKLYQLEKCQNGGLYDPFTDKCWLICSNHGKWKRTGCR